MSLPPLPKLGLPELPDIPDLPPLPTPETSPVPALELPALPVSKDSMSEPGGSDIESYRALVRENFRRRIDTYYDGVFVEGSQSRWVAGDNLRAAKDARLSLAKPWDKYLMKDRDVLTTLTDQSLTDSRLGLASATEIYGTLTAEQAKDITGINAVADIDQPSVRALFATGVIDIGEFVMPLTSSKRHRHPHLYRAPKPGLARKTLADTHGFTQLAQIDGALPRTPRIVMADRHNTLTVEVLLRAAERIKDVKMILGEKLASTKVMHPDDYPGNRTGSYRRPGPEPARGDGMIVLDSGVKVVIETTSTTTSSPSFVRKVKRWNTWLRDHSMRTDPVVVLFLVAPNERYRKAARLQEDSIAKHIGSLLTGPRMGPDSPSARIGVVSWESWFPSPGVIDDDAFESLRVRTAQADWDTVDWASLAPRLRDPDAARAVITNAALLASTPWWLRMGEHTDAMGGTLDEVMNAPLPRRAGYRGRAHTQPERAFAAFDSSRPIGALGDPARAVIPRR